jgi:hypothetical protein
VAHVVGGVHGKHPAQMPLTEDQQPQRHAGIMSDQRSPLVSDPSPTSGTPQGSRGQLNPPAWPHPTATSPANPTTTSAVRGAASLAVRPCRLRGRALAPPGGLDRMVGELPT